MNENEYKDNEKVLYKTRAKLSLPHKEFKEVECFVTEGHVVIEAEEIKKIPVSRIEGCRETIDYPISYRYDYHKVQEPLSGTVALTFFDEQKRKQRLSLRMEAEDVRNVKQAIDKQMAPVGRGQVEIKEKGEQHMVIKVDLGGCSLIFGLIFVIVWTLIVQIIPVILIRVLFSLAGVYGILAILRRLMAIRVVLDKPTQTVTIRKPSLFLVSRRRIIPFSYVRSVVIDYKPQVSGSGESSTLERAWKVSLNIGSEKFEIAHTTEKADMYYLASEISTFIGRELVDNSAGPEISFQRFFHKVKGFFRK